MKRRDFILQSIYLGSGALVSNISLAKDFLNNEALKKKHAKYIFQFSSPYFTKDYLTTPHAHLEIKHFIESYTQGKVYVEIVDGGANGIGAVLGNKVKYGVTQGALLSVSNLTPMVNCLDILNIPFWSSAPNDFLRLFKSKIWNEHILSNTAQHNLQVLMPYVVGARTATSTKQYGKTIKTAKDFEGLRFRVPASKSLQKFYQMAKAKPIIFDWAHTAKGARHNRFSGLDPSVIGLYSGPDNLNKDIGIISEIESVHDGWVAIANTDFLNSVLDVKTRIQFLDAFEEIQQKQLMKYKSCKKLCSDKFKELGTIIYTPTTTEKQMLKEQFGPQNSIWNQTKLDLLGPKGLHIFEKLYLAAKG